MPARRGASRSPEFYGGLLGANVVLGIYTLNDMGLLWFFYWPLAAVAIVLGYGMAARITERWPSRGTRSKAQDVRGAREARERHADALTR